MAIVAVDPALRGPGSPEPPAGVGPFTINLDKAVSVIGRTSSSRAIYPEIPLNFDEAVSHRHALLQRGGDGSLALRDIGAANGTRLNGKDVEPMVDYPLRDGDEIALGHWTKITVQAVL
jgi:pSer/pThr/pTyr-binding forkhead associated (FHA) protein